jgi:hypothetical protein
MPLQSWKTPIKEWAWRIGVGIFFLLCALQVLGNFVNWIRGVDDGRPHEGQQCGPSHHWVYLRTNVQDAELSCEPDR